MPVPPAPKISAPKELEFPKPAETPGPPAPPLPFTPPAPPAPPAPALTTVSEGPMAWDAARAAWTNTWVETPFTPTQVAAAADAALSALVLNRNVLLYQCDWTQLPDVELTAPQVADWRTYRQSLRDYPDTVVDPFNPPAWPTPPGDSLSPLL